jgi:hypothetical protein
LNGQTQRRRVEGEGGGEVFPMTNSRAAKREKRGKKGTEEEGVKRG